MQTMLAWQRKTAVALFNLLRSGVLERHLRRGWAYAATGYFAAILLYLLAQIIVNVLFNLHGAGFGETLALLFGRYMLLACLALLGCVNLAARGYDHATVEDRPLFAWAISGAALLGPALSALGLLGLLGYVIVGGTFGDVLYELLVQVAGMTLAFVAGLWALSWVGAHQAVAAVPAQQGQGTEPASAV